MCFTQRRRKLYYSFPRTDYLKRLVNRCKPPSVCNQESVHIFLGRESCKMQIMFSVNSKCNSYLKSLRTLANQE